MILKALVLQKFEFDKGSTVSANQLNELKTRALSKVAVAVMFFGSIITIQIKMQLFF